MENSEEILEWTSSEEEQTLEEIIEDEEEKLVAAERVAYILKNKPIWQKGWHQTPPELGYLVHNLPPRGTMGNASWVNFERRLIGVAEQPLHLGSSIHVFSFPQSRVPDTRLFPPQLHKNYMYRGIYLVAAMGNDGPYWLRMTQDQYTLIQQYFNIGSAPLPSSLPEVTTTNVAHDVQPMGPFQAFTPRTDFIKEANERRFSPLTPAGHELQHYMAIL